MPKRKGLFVRPNHASYSKCVLLKVVLFAIKIAQPEIHSIDGQTAFLGRRFYRRGKATRTQRQLGSHGCDLSGKADTLNKCAYARIGFFSGDLRISIATAASPGISPF